MDNKFSNNLTFYCLLITVFLDQVGMFLVHPILPSLLHSINHKSIIDNSVIGAWLLAIYGLMQFIFAPIMGAVSDRFGRKPVLIICFFAFAINYLLFFFASNIYILFLARIISGIAGSSIVVSMASIADISSENDRTSNYAYIFAMFSLGMVVGPFISSVSVDYGIHIPFLLSAILSFLCLLMIIFIFKETLSIDNRQNFVFRSPISSFMSVSKSNSKVFIYLLIIQLLFGMSVQTPITLWAFFTKNRFTWSDVEVSYSFVMLGALGFFVQTYLVKKLYPLLGDVKITYLGFFAFTIGLIFIALSFNEWIFYLSLVFYSIAAISNSSVTSLFSAQVSASEQGQLMGIRTSILSLCNIIGPIISGYIYYFSVNNIHTFFSDGIPFLLSAVISIICILMLHHVLGYKNDYKVE